MKLDSSAAVEQLDQCETPSPVRKDRTAAILQETAADTNALTASAEQCRGFQTPSEFTCAVEAGNRKVRNDARRYCEQALVSLLYAHNGELPHSVILCECSDGRNGGPEMFSRDPNIRFGKTWKPQAGLLMFPSLIAAASERGASTETVDMLLDDPETRVTLFHQAEALFADDLRHHVRLAEAATITGKHAVIPGHIPPAGTSLEILQLAAVLYSQSGAALRGRAAGNSALVSKIAGLGRRFPVTLELQSHSDPHHPEHGCGAHGSNLGKTLAMSAMNALILKAYIDDRHPEYADDIRVALTHHFTGSNEAVYDVQSPSIFPFLESTLRDRVLQENFRPRFLKDPDEGVVRRGKGNHLQINLDVHDEYIIRISEYHKASGLEKTSVLEQSMLPDAALMEMITLKLISIAQENRLQRDPDQPLFLHLDTPADDDGMAAQYGHLEQRLSQHTIIRDLIASSKLHVVRSRTQPFSFERNDRLQTEFLH